MDVEDINQVWDAAQLRLPDGWILDNLRCASGSLAVEDRSDDWIASAIGPNGEPREYRAADARSAIDGLVRSFEFK
jgi:hypothetical protein